jgi:hypothetical protein
MPGCHHSACWCSLPGITRFVTWTIPRSFRRIERCSDHYGAKCQRPYSAENYDITGIRLDHYPEFIKALGMTKKACAKANHQLVGLALGFNV